MFRHSVEAVAFALVLLGGSEATAQIRVTLPPITVTAQKEPEDPHSLPLSVRALVR